MGDSSRRGRGAATLSDRSVDPRSSRPVGALPLAAKDHPSAMLEREWRQLAERYVIKHDRMFLVTDAAGNASGRADDAGGLYLGDTRFLSRYELTTAGAADVEGSGSSSAASSSGALQVVANSARAGDRARIVLLPDPVSSWSGPERELVIERERVIRDGFLERIRITNRGNARATLRLWLHFAADFKDMFEVRGMQRGRRGVFEASTFAGDGTVHLSYIGLDGWRYETVVQLSPQPAELVLVTKEETASGHAPGASAGFVCDLEAKSEALIEVYVTASQQPGAGSPPAEAPLAVGKGPSAAGERTVAAGERAAAAEMAFLAVPRKAAVDRPEFAAAWSASQADEESWRTGCAVWETDNEEVNAVLRQAERDLRMLASDFGKGFFPVAGVPWYAVPFGRDSLIASLQALSLRPDLAAGTLRTLAGWQGRRHDLWRDEAPGKILHELRTGELARTGEVPFGPYFGTIDATPLFLILAGEYWRWTGDSGLIRELLPALRAAASWMDADGDLDGDGYVEYHRRQDGGLANQGWKDSGDAIVHRDGRLAEPPIALVEVQGYVYAARMRFAELLEAVGEPAEAAAQREKAARLKAAFDRDFWVEETGFYALALDKEKRPVASVTTNPGHCLWTGIVPGYRAARMAEVFLSPEMFTGYGLRTLAASEHAYHPLSYHRGSVWPHDNSLVVLGLARYGQGEAAARIANGLFAAASFDPMRRLPELFGGFPASDDGPVGYPVACVPQAWAAATPFMLLQAVLGLEVDAPSSRVRLSPHLPAGINRVEVRRMRFGDRHARVAVERRADGGYACSVDVSSGPQPEVVVGGVVFA